MFLKYSENDIPYVATPSNLTTSSSINHAGAFPLPTKALDGMPSADKQLGCKDIAGYLESIHYRKKDAGALTASMMSSIVDKARELDLETQKQTASS